MKVILSLSLVILLSHFSRAQSFAINTDGSVANNSSILDVKSITKGILIPRMDSLQRASIPSPATGLLVYQTNKDSGFYHYDGTAWQQLVSSSNNLWKRNDTHIYNSNTGSIGIGTNNPLAKLHVLDSNVVFSASGDAPGAPGTVPISGAGRRMMWYANKAAFRSGYVDAAYWDAANIGNYSAAFGRNTTASGIGATSFGIITVASGGYSLSSGELTTASGNYSTAMGSRSIASGSYSTSLGYQTFASGMISTSMGETTTASGQYSTSTGYHTTASGASSISMGTNTTASGNNSTSMGGSTTASGFSSTSMGANTTASATASTSMGNGTIAKSSNSLVIGSNNDTSNTNRLFEIGNGTAFNARSNALTVLTNGNTGIGTSTPGYRLDLANGNFAFGNSNTRTETRDNASLQGNAGAQSGFFETSSPVNYPAGASSWWHLIDTRHSNGVNNFAMQIAGSFFDQELWFRKTNGTAINPWTRLLTAGNISSCGWSITGNSGSNATNNFIGTTDAVDLVIRTNNVETMRVKTNGNVGIGTSNPTKQTEIVGAASATPVTLVIGNRGGFGPAAMEFVSDYGLANQWRPGYIRSNDLGVYTGALEFYTNGTGVGNLYGNVKGLEVRNGVSYTATGTVSSWSDIRLKKDVQPFTGGLDIINQINPVSFYYNERSPFQTEKMQIGILAQELEKVAPYMVDKNVTKDFEDLRSVNNQAYIFLLVNAVKEQDKKIEAQQKQIDEQRKLIEQLLKK